MVKTIQLKENTYDRLCGVRDEGTTFDYVISKLLDGVKDEG